MRATINQCQKNNVDACPDRTFHGNVSFVVKFFEEKNGGRCGVTQPTLLYGVKVFWGGVLYCFRGIGTCEKIGFFGVIPMFRAYMGVAECL